MTPTKPSRNATCPRCGGRMSAGHGKGREPSACASCTRAAHSATKAPHGTASCYSRGCRRPECRAAWAEYMRDYMRRRRANAKAGSAESS